MLRDLEMFDSSLCCGHFRWIFTSKYIICMNCFTDFLYRVESDFRLMVRLLWKGFICSSLRGSQWCSNWLVYQCSNLGCSSGGRGARGQAQGNHQHWATLSQTLNDLKSLKSIPSLGTCVFVCYSGIKISAIIPHQYFLRNICERDFRTLLWCIRVDQILPDKIAIHFYSFPFYTSDETYKVHLQIIQVHLHLLWIFMMPNISSSLLHCHYAIVNSLDTVIQKIGWIKKCYLSPSNVPIKAQQPWSVLVGIKTVGNNAEHGPQVVFVTF